jgi:RimJ/RimL family protein N-acetyltransferase
VIELRRATQDDVEFLTELYADEETEPFLSGHATHTIADDVQRSLDEPQRSGRMIVLVDGERAGAMFYDERSEQHRIAHLSGLAVLPSFRGRGVGEDAARQLQQYLFVELGYHRIELACYGFNERAIRHSERVGFVREGVKRRAYLRHGEWQDAVQFGLLREDLEP